MDSEDEAEMAAMRSRRGQQSVRPAREQSIDQSIDSDEESMRMMFPTEFGAKKQKQTPNQSINQSIDQSHHPDIDDDIIVKPEPSMNQLIDQSTSIDSMLASLISQHSLSTICPTFPMTSHQSINQSVNQSRKPVQSLSLSFDGSLMLSGSADYSLSYFEFSSMNQSFRPSVSVTVMDGQPVIDQSINQDASIIAVATMSSSIKLLDRKGATISQTVDGDRYLVDQKRTTGATASVCTVKFMPINQSKFVSGGRDGVIRLWDVNQSKNIDVIKMRGAPARGLTISSIDISNDGSKMVSAATDGSVRLYSCSAPTSAQVRFAENQSISNSNAHSRSCWVSSVKFSRDNQSIFTRGGDGEHCVKIWDIRNMRHPVASINQLECGHEQSDVAESPDSSMLLVACADGQLAIIDRSVNQLKCFVPIHSKSLIRAIWHPVLNQIFVSTCDGLISAFYDRKLSKRGMLQCINRLAGKRALDTTDGFDTYASSQSINQSSRAVKSARFEGPGPAAPNRSTNRLTATQIAMKSIVKQRVNPLTVKAEDALRTIQTLANTQAQERQGK